MKYYGVEQESIHPVGCKAMTWEDAEAMEELNAKHSWSFSIADEAKIVMKHKNYQKIVKSSEDEAERNNAIAEQEKIEWRLEDANFHTLCRFLRARRYLEAMEYVIKEAEAIGA